ncbi:MAG: cobyric acid synthase [Desulforhopalus sp.]
MNRFEHGGNIHKIRRESGTEQHQVIDFSANINPLGPPEWMRPLISSRLESLIHYPDPENIDFIEAIVEKTGMKAANIVAANGTTELLYIVLRSVNCRRAVVPVPSYVDYVQAAELADIPVKNFLLREEEDFELNYGRLAQYIQPGDLVIIATPNNPTGRTVDRDEIVKLIKDFPQCIFLIDEAFLDFVEESRSLGGQAENVMTLNSMTKFYGVPGLRIGYGVFPEGIARLVRKNLPPWTVNSLAQAFGARAMKDSKYQLATVKTCHDLRQDLVRALGNFPQLRIYHSDANYLFIKLIDGTDTEKLAEFCLQQGIMIRRCDNYQGLSSGAFFRVAVRTRQENNRLVEVLQRYFPGITGKNNVARKARSIMIQGTCSDAGKSIITAALCRIFYQDGVAVAPFKAQNMSLNSFVTLHGDEMGRAQVVQAQAAKIDPDCRMNPILLKPNSDTGSQIVLCGKPVGNMSVLEYNDYKPKAWDGVRRSYDRLAEDFDVVVLEGAGSPGEVNLKADDIVNMRMAQYAGAPVILVGDIDRGGVYASFVGIMEVLAEWERKLVAGFLVNKFRGQASLLESAHRYVQLHTNRRVFGVVPYLANLGLPEEDSVSFKKGSFNSDYREEGIELVVINLPHISNFTDIEPFLEEPDVAIRIVDNADDIGNPQAIVLPGSKNVINDLKFLRSKGLVEKINRCLENGSEVIGICGGYQMLGRGIEDPHGIESPDGHITGLGYLDMDTVLEIEKNLTRKTGKHSLSQQRVYGYEIHHGISSLNGMPVVEFDDGTTCGIMNPAKNIWGCYLHGIFDSDEFRRWFIDRLRVKAGLVPVGKILAPYNLERAFDRLADCVRDNVDIAGIYRLMGM